MVVDSSVAKQLLYSYVDVVTTIGAGLRLDSKFLSANAQQQQSLIYSGYLKAFDPVTSSSILCLIEDNIVRRNLIVLGCNIIDIIPSLTTVNKLSPTEAGAIIELDSQTKAARHPFYQRTSQSGAGLVTLEGETLVEVRDEIVDWLKVNRLPVSVDEQTHEIQVAGSIRINPPYEHETDFVCPTRVVFKRIKHIISSRPR